MDRRRCPRARYLFPVLLALFGLTACGGPSGGEPSALATSNSTVSPVSRASLIAGQIGGPGNLDGQDIAARFDHPADIARDSAGNLYIADYNNSTIRKISPSGNVTTLAGLADEPGSADGVGSTARFNHPQNLAIDAGGNLFVSDSWNNTIRKITPAGVVSTLAGVAGLTGSQDGTGASASFNMPGGMVISSSGSLYVADSGNDTIREISPTGTVTTIAGTAAVSGHADGPALQATFNMPTFLALDAAGNLDIADSWNNTIRQLSPNGVVTTLAGSAGVAGSADGTGSAARFSLPYGLHADNAGNLWVADSCNHEIREISPAGVVTTVAGTVQASGSNDGPAASAQFSYPLGLTIDADNNVYIVDNGNNDIRDLSSSGNVTTLAGAPANPGASDGNGANARFNTPVGVVADSAGNLYVADAGNNVVRKITPDGSVLTYAGIPGQTGSADGALTEATFNSPTSLAIDSQGNFYVSDSLNNTIRKISVSGTVSTVAGSPSQTGSADGNGSAAEFSYPSGIALDAAGNIYVADNGNNTIREISPQGMVATLAGSPGVAGSSDGTGSTASFDHPAGLAVDGNGNIFVADAFNNVIRKITPKGVVSTLAGTAGRSGSADGTGSAARFNEPVIVTVDAQDNLYVGDWLNNSVRLITANGSVSTLLGTPADAGVRVGANPRPGGVQGMVLLNGGLVFTTANGVVTAALN